VAWLRAKSEDQGFDANQEIKLHSYENWVFPECNPTLVEFAAYYGAEQSIRHLAKIGAEFRPRTPRQFAFTHFAVAGGFPNVARILEQKGCSFKGILVTCAQFHQNELFKVYYGSKDREVNAELLWQSAAANNVETLLFAIEHGVDAAQMNDDGENALHYAARHGCVDAVRFLITVKTVDVNAGHHTPLHYAAFYGFEDVVQLLLSYSRVNVNAQVDGTGVSCVFTRLFFRRPLVLAI
jgi:ankyrin repeat protein